MATDWNGRIQENTDSPESQFSFRIACRGRPDHSDRSPDPLVEDVHPIKGASDVGLSPGGLQNKAWRWQPEDGVAHCQFASPSSNQPTKSTLVVTHGNAISYSDGNPAMLPSVVRVQLLGRRFNGPAKNTRSGAGSSINYTMECDGPFEVLRCAAAPSLLLTMPGVTRCPGAMPLIDYRVLNLAWAVPAENAKRNTTIPRWIPGFPSRPWSSWTRR